jgi:hypothetical protein
MEVFSVLFVNEFLPLIHIGSRYYILLETPVALCVATLQSLVSPFFQGVDTCSSSLPKCYKCFLKACELGQKLHLK